ncbi:MAG: tannase/feruloyl esterase family alpha/beta hydrolase [Gemmatimonadetes bacterium]|nr:tannase/feruloyl esterase family alpha/beta hydrolase [Gemmatimonadota bacterium]
MTAIVASRVSAASRGIRTSRAHAVPCDSASLAALQLGHAQVTGATHIAAGPFTIPGTQLSTAPLPAFCRVRGEASSGAGSLIRFELWFPDGDAWNAKLLVTGNAGYSPMLAYGDMAMALRRGYAVMGGDTGHQTENPDDLSFVVGHHERMLDWGARSIHVITAAGKTIGAALGAKPVRRSYFFGCSTGGHQGVAELEAYPDDFDGVIAGAPGNNRVRLNAGFLWQYRANHAAHDDTMPILTPASLALVGRAVVAACDANDGVRDGVIDDPRDCAWTPDALRCADDRASPACLSPVQVAALKAMYGGARNPRTGAQIYPGWPKGSEAPILAPDGSVLGGWNRYWGTNAPARADFWRYWVFDDPKWDWWSFDFDRDLAVADAKAGSAIDHTSADLSAFRRRGGKAILYQGWADPVVSAYDAIAYYEKVRAAQGSQSATDGFLRLFMVPGMAHCARGPGATNFGNQGGDAPVCDAEHDLIEALDAWVERGTAPDRIIASRVENGAVTRTRALCPYPRRARYAGRGNPDDATSFTCR